MAVVRAQRVRVVFGAAAVLALAQTPVKSDIAAWSGEPFGVAIIHQDAPAGIVHYPDRPVARLAGPANRPLYPVIHGVSDAAGDRGSGRLTAAHAWFLFRGREPFEVELTFADGSTLRKTVRPAANAQAHQRELSDWWTRYVNAAQANARFEGYPPLVENYLLTMLARRLSFDTPVLNYAWSGRKDIDEVLGVLTGAESVRLAMQRDTFLAGTRRGERAIWPLPTMVIPPSMWFPDPPADVPLEPIAGHVPAECFYVRTGSYGNFVWLRDRLEQWGGPLRNVASVRGLDYGIRERLERQLALRETVLSRWLGATVIADVAVIGTDTFIREGPSLGVLFEARNADVLAEQLGLLRQEAAEEEPAARFSTESIAGRKVSLLSTPDNRLRSFYAVDGQYHLVTTSRTIVRRFFEAGSGTDALSGLKEFRHARHLMPLSREDSVFIYLSDPFFRQLITPASRVEMTRRMQALSEIELTEIARLAAAAEQQPAETIQQLIEGGFLPADFEMRPDGSRTLLAGGRLRDSLRGGRGCFTPVADVGVTRVTSSETKAYQEFNRTYRSLWERIDPVIVGIQRRPAATGRERVVLDVHITPYAGQELRFLAMLLPSASAQRMAAVPDDVASLEVRLPGHFFSGSRKSGSAFAGLRDFSPDFSIENGEVKLRRPADEELPAYLGSELEDFLGWLVRGIDWDQADPDGYLALPAGGGINGWARRHGGFMTVSPRRDVLEQVTPHLRVEEAERPAQIRLRIADLERRLVTPLMNAHGYLQARKTSGTNTQLLHALIEQLHVPPQDALRRAAAVLDAKLACPLGGRYTLNEPEGDFPEWTSTAWDSPSLYAIDAVPDGYRFDLLDWFHGLDLEFRIDRTTLDTRIELELGQGNDE